MEERELPQPGSAELAALVTNTETAAVYQVLYETRESPLDMLAIRDRVEALTGSANEHTGRRLRDLRTHFQIELVKVPGSGRPCYVLQGWHPNADSRTRRTTVRGSLRARAFQNYGDRCARCGRTPKDDGVRLELDHRTPLDLGGDHELENLQPLCQQCNNEKQAMFAEHDADGSAIRAAITQKDVYLRMGELLKAKEGEEVSVDLINLVARDENHGDPTRRLRDLRALGWKIDTARRKEGKRTMTYYTLLHWEPWPAEGPRAAVNALESARKRRKKAEGA
ncbi:HNH endonuclease [Streptomyces sioyaensis]|uniref:HNH endonuclease n=1 Tax=Streptomyces sioyaensis TaxID=67364 RepID=UPI0037B27F8E